MTFETALKKIKAKFEEVDASKLADMAVQVTLTDEDCGGTLYFKAAEGKVVVEGYDYRDNDAVIDIDRKALNDILSGKLTLDKAIEKGLATAKGNFDKLATLNDAIPKYVAPAKKEEAAKTVAAPAVVETAKVEPVKVETVKEAAPVKKTAVKKVAEPAVKKPVATAAKKTTVTKKATTTAKKSTAKKA